MIRAIAIFCLSVIALGLSVSAIAQEKITDFAVNIAVQTDGDIQVTETISVISQGNEIQRGIFRDLPRYFDDDGDKIPQDYEDVTVTKNGAREPFDVSSDGTPTRIRIGQANVFLNPGPYTYQIAYRAKNQIRYFETYDELYWNVTGNYWNFPIEKASVTITLPSNPPLLDRSAYTGAVRDRGGQYSYRQQSGSHEFYTTSELARREGLTVSVSFEKGIIDPPSSGDKRAVWWAKNGALASLVASLLGIWAYYTRAWHKVGRDPIKGPVIPLYGPPEGYSAAACGYIYDKGQSGNKALVATLMGLAGKEYIEIDVQSKRKTVMRYAPNTGPRGALNKEEKSLLSKLFGASSGVVTLAGKYNAQFTKGYGRFAMELHKLYGAPYYKRNGGYHILGLMLSFFAFGLAVTQSTGNLKLPLYIVIGILILTNIVFLILLPAPTKKGQNVRTAIEGFRLFMKTAESGRLNAADISGAQPPPMTTKRYEALLPYAVALGVEKPWTKYFEAVLPIEAENFKPTGMQGHFASGRSLDQATKSMVSSLNSGVSSAMPSSSSSSGRSGGGSSGGGGGGGGGGGW